MIARSLLVAASVATVATSMSVPNTCFAQGKPKAATTPAQKAAAPPAQPAAAPSSAKVEEARKRYSAGLKLYEDGNYEAARIEFERAMELAPSYRILYNVGLAYKQLNNYVGALRVFDEYLATGGIEIPAARRAEVEKDVIELRQRIAKITIKTNVPDADVSIDDVGVGKSPLSEPVLVNPGVRKVSASAAGRFPVTKSVTVGGSESVVVTLELAEPTTRVVERRSNPWVVPTIVGFSATGAALIATGVFGVLALNAKDDQEDLNKQFSSSREARESARDKTTTLSTATDVLAVTTVVFAGVSAYFTIRMLGHKPEHAEVKAGQRPPLDLKVGLGGLTAVGTF